MVSVHTSESACHSENVFNDESTCRMCPLLQILYLAYVLNRCREMAVV